MKCKVLVVMMLLSIAGCIPTTQQVQTATNKTDTLMVVVDKMQEAFEVLVKDGVIKSEKLEALSDEIDEAQERLVIVNEAIKEKADESALDQLVAANEASRPFNPYADEVNAVLGLVAVIGGIWAKGQYDKRKESDTSLEEVVIGVEDSKKNGGNLKSAFNATESLVTRRKVAKILNNT